MPAWGCNQSGLPDREHQLRFFASLAFDANNLLCPGCCILCQGRLRSYQYCSTTISLRGPSFQHGYKGGTKVLLKSRSSGLPRTARGGMPRPRGFRTIPCPLATSRLCMPPEVALALSHTRQCTGRHSCDTRNARAVMLMEIFCF